MVHTGIYIYIQYIIHIYIYRYIFYGYPSHIGNPLKLENGLITIPNIGIRTWTIWIYTSFESGGFIGVAIFQQTKSLVTWLLRMHNFD